jgi:inorganic pyrophosphatase
MRSSELHCDLIEDPVAGPCELFQRFAGPVAVRCELASWSFAKRKVDGSIDYVSPLPCPFAYGELENTRSGDGAPIDALILGAGPAVGALNLAHLIAVVDFVDNGEFDPKLIVRLGNAKPLSHRERWQVFAFFALWTPFKAILRLKRRQSGRTRFRGLFESR